MNRFEIDFTATTVPDGMCTASRTIEKDPLYIPLVRLLQEKRNTNIRIVFVSYET